MEKRNRDLKVVVVRPEEYPQVVVIEDVTTWFSGAYIQIPAYTQDTVILAPEQREGLTLNRGLFDPGQTQMRQIVAGDFLVCGISEDGGFRNTNASGPSEEIARLAGIRFVNISEPEKKLTFNAALVKRLTGNDTINARYLHENSFDFKPVFKIFINTNYLPNVSDMTLFDSGRLKIIPFKRHFKHDIRPRYSIDCTDLHKLNCWEHLDKYISWYIL